MKTVLHRLLTLTIVFALGAFVACGDDDVAGSDFQPGPTSPTSPTGGDGSPNPPTTPRGNAAARISTVSGGGQTWRTHAPLPNPFVVKVVDDRGIRVEGATVEWVLEKGNGFVGEQSVTDSLGLSTMDYRTGILGRDVVEARVDGVTMGVRFTVNTEIVGIDILSGRFYSGQEDPLRVAKQTPIVIENHDVETHRLVTLSAPSGGVALESGPLARGETYPFKSSVAGTWIYRCDLHPEEEPGVLIIE